jgi:hypothetical protein
MGGKLARRIGHNRPVPPYSRFREEAVHIRDGYLAANHGPDVPPLALCGPTLRAGRGSAGINLQDLARFLGSHHREDSRPIISGLTCMLKDPGDQPQFFGLHGVEQHSLDPLAVTVHELVPMVMVQVERAPGQQVLQAI